MTAQRPTPRPHGRDVAALWAAAFPAGFVLLLLGLRDESAVGTGLVVAAAVCFAVAVAAVAGERGRRRAAERI